MNLLCLRACECIKRLGCDEATLVAAKQPNVGTALGLLAEVFHLVSLEEWQAKYGGGPGLADGRIGKLIEHEH